MAPEPKASQKSSDQVAKKQSKVAKAKKQLGSQESYIAPKPSRMGTFDQENSVAVNIIRTDASIKAHKKLAKDGTHRRKFTTGFGYHPRKARFAISVSELNKQAFKNSQSSNAFNSLTRMDTAMERHDSSESKPQQQSARQN